jgi:hypothetical protein
LLVNLQNLSKGKNLPLVEFLGFFKGKQEKELLVACNNDKKDKE